MKSSSSQINAVVFDLFETLITEVDLEQSSKSYVAQVLGVEEEDFRREWSARLDARYRGQFDSYADVLTSICGILGAKPKKDDISSLHDQRIENKAKPYARIEDAVINMLRDIKTLGLKVGLISNCTAEEVAAWPDSKLAPFFDAVTFSWGTHHVKPEPEAYLLACRQLEVSPDTVVFVGDGGSNELTGAARVGMLPVWATWHLRRWPHWNYNSHSHASSYHEVKSPLALSEYVQRLRSI